MAAVIVSASRRTDIPAYHTNWFYGRLAAGFVEVANPYNTGQMRRVELTKEAVEGFVFWTKDPGPMLEGFEALDGWPLYFGCTLTAYPGSVEPAFAGRREEIAKAMEAIVAQRGLGSVVWRYDPVVFGDEFDAHWHAAHFERLAARLAGVVDSCIISFYDEYRHTKRAMEAAGLRAPNGEEMLRTASLLAGSAGRHGIRLQSCCEAVDLTGYGIFPGACIDAGRLAQLAGLPIEAGKDKNQRPACGCAASVDIGAYSTCPGGCVYCYARRGKAIKPL